MSDGLIPPKATVLIVDDEPHIREIVRRTLIRHDLNCLVAANAEEAWQQLQEQPIDLVTLDVTLPGESGIDLLKRIHATFEDVSVVLLTAIKSTETAIQALDNGACAYLNKPIDQEDLLFHVRRSLERRHLILERRAYLGRLEERVVEQTDQIRLAHEETIHRLVAASMYRDKETGAHIRRVGLCSGVLAHAIGWEPDQVARMRLAAPMHDVGKIGIPDRILQKNGGLNRDETEIMQSHTIIGAHLLAGSESPMLTLAAEIALSHHEQWDGTGYPHRLAGEEIPVESRIVAIVDVYDALTHDRVYRPAMPEERAIGILRQGSGTHFDAALLDTFFDVLPEIRQISVDHPDQELEAEVRELCCGTPSNMELTSFARAMTAVSSY